MVPSFPAAIAQNQSREQALETGTKSNAEASRGYLILVPSLSPRENKDFLSLCHDFATMRKTVDSEPSHQGTNEYARNQRPNRSPRQHEQTYSRPTDPNPRPDSISPFSPFARDASLSFASLLRMKAGPQGQDLETANVRPQSG